MALVAFEWVLAAGVVILALMFWVIHILLDVQRLMRSSLASFEDKLIQLEDESRRLSHDAASLKSTLAGKVESGTLSKRLDDLSSLMGLSSPKR